MSGPLADAIRRIEDRIGDERYWCRGRSYQGEQACVIGAASEVESWDAVDLLYEVANDTTGLPVVTVNDHLGHEAVMLLLATALDIAEAEGL